MDKLKLLKHISVNKDICHGKPCIRGTRIMVEQVLDLLAGGATPEEIIENDFPALTAEDVRACIAFANQLLKDEEIRFYETERAEII